MIPSAHRAYQIVDSKGCLINLISQYCFIRLHHYERQGTLNKRQLAAVK